jgi:histone acetyltransferase HTATIP
VLNSRKSRTGAREAYISFAGEDKRLDAWVAASVLGDEVATAGPSRLVGVLDGVVSCST